MVKDELDEEKTLPLSEGIISLPLSVCRSDLALRVHFETSCARFRKIPSRSILVRLQGEAVRVKTLFTIVPPINVTLASIACSERLQIEAGCRSSCCLSPKEAQATHLLP